MRRESDPLFDFWLEPCLSAHRCHSTTPSSQIRDLEPPSSSSMAEPAVFPSACKLKLANIPQTRPPNCKHGTLVRPIAAFLQALRYTLYETPGIFIRDESRNVEAHFGATVSWTFFLYETPARGCSSQDLGLMTILDSNLRHWIPIQVHWISNLGH